jgi:hypothetical protein
VLRKPHDHILVVPKNRTHRWKQELHKLHHLQALAITPSEDSIVYIRTKVEGWFLKKKSKLYLRSMQVDLDGNVIMQPPKKVLLHHPFLQSSGSNLSVISDSRGVHCFIVHCSGIVEKVTFETGVLLDTPA